MSEQSRAPGNLADVRLIEVDGRAPQIHETAFIAPGVTLIGDVTIGARSSVFYGSVLRAERAAITIGEDTNVQDNTVMHCDPGFDVTVGSRVSIGHAAMIHGCTIEDDCLIGMSTTLLNGAVVGSYSLVAAKALILEGASIPAGSLVAGVPGKVRRELDEEGRAHVDGNWRSYREIARIHMEQSRIL
ncbi:gamma carbonic anhydrase family protein [Brevibacterium yomogidense]|uniref:gamma carbonic anhydrase family protein n=1 Tax=Brevibacterium yomogidense TaxID=946573 RepID=UPI0018DF5542|nr:gamma carbonic anhydrase family protein [Brevibacterium yomogidense]